MRPLPADAPAISLNAASLGGNYTIELAYFAATLTVSAKAGTVVTASCNGTTYSGTAASTGKATITIKKAGTYTVTGVYSGVRQHTKSSGENYSPDYLKNVHTQLSCIFNHAIKYYGLQINPAAKAGNMGSEQPKEMLFWTKEEYLKFIDAMMDKPMLYYAFEILYWCGIREGELLALTPADFDFKKKTLRINKSYQRLQGKDVITTPKTKKSNRVIQMPDFLCDEIQDYFKHLYGLEADSRIFPLSKYALKRGMAYGCKASGVKVIRIHDLRHSHVSLLINMGYSAVAIGNRVGHESVEITYRYAHLFPTVQKEMADKLNVERSN